tara:strand:+ start:643 stop:846 length:204 start_codon:yes stop_codon:yes gene_type:complete
MARYRLAEYTVSKMLIEKGVATAADQDLCRALRARRQDPSDQRAPLMRDEALVTATPASALTAGQNT